MQKLCLQWPQQKLWTQDSSAAGSATDVSHLQAIPFTFTEVHPIFIPWVLPINHPKSSSAFQGKDAERAEI